MTRRWIEDTGDGAFVICEEPSMTTTDRLEALDDPVKEAFNPKMTETLDSLKVAIASLRFSEREWRDKALATLEAEVGPPKDGYHYAWVKGVGWCPGENAIEDHERADRLEAEMERLREALEGRCPRCGEWFRDAPSVRAALAEEKGS